MNKDKAIGIFDSGIGGLTVMREVMRTLPSENLIYFGDTARVPYGEKSPETILRYSIENTEFLMKHQVKAIVVACNTATACALGELTKKFPVPLMGVIEPSVDKALAISPRGRIAVLGTKATINSGVYQKEIVKRNPEASVLPIACPLLVPLVEENFISHPASRMILGEYLKPIRQREIDTVVLGCTHYPLLAHLIEEELGPDIQVVNSAAACAENLSKLLGKSDIYNSNPGTVSHKFYVSDDPQKFRSMGNKFLGMPIEITEIYNS